MYTTTTTNAGCLEKKKMLITCTNSSSIHFPFVFAFLRVRICDHAEAQSGDVHRGERMLISIESGERRRARYTRAHHKSFLMLLVPDAQSHTVYTLSDITRTTTWRTSVPL